MPRVQCTVSLFIELSLLSVILIRVTPESSSFIILSSYSYHVIIIMLDTYSSNRDILQYYTLTELQLLFKLQYLNSPAGVSAS